MTQDKGTFDVVVVGAGPAGATAAISLAEKGHTVALVEAAKCPREGVQSGWVSGRATELLGALGLSHRKLGSQAIRSVVFYNADLSKSATPGLSEPPGHLLDRTRLSNALVERAIKAGAKLFDGCRVVDVASKERSVELQSDQGDSVCGRLLIVAVGQASPLLDRLKLDRAEAQGGFWAAQVETGGVQAKSGPVVKIVLGLDGGSGFGIAGVCRDRAWVGVCVECDKAEVGARLTLLARKLAEAEIVPVDLSKQAASAGVTITPAAIALDMDTHVAKHVLLIGDAGGFVSGSSGEGIYPAMWSARVACEVASDALGAPNPQDVLIEFNTRWRTQMADYLRPPTTDPQYLLPLIFSNQPMADRMAAAFFLGENI